MRTQRPTMSDVAARAGVSRTLVSFILAGKPGAGEQTRDRVLRAGEREAVAAAGTDEGVAASG